MKSEDESKQYYLTLIISFIFLGISFSILAFPKNDAKMNDYNDISLLVNEQHQESRKEVLVKYTTLDSQNQNKNLVYSIISSKPNIVIQDKKEYIYIEYGSKSDSETAINIRKNYGEIITKYANMYGLDPNLVIALATQERGSGHSTKIDAGGAVGIMQIQYNSWIGNKIKAYNFNDKNYEIIKIDDSIRTLDGNIKVGCMILQSEMKKHNYNVIAGLQAYNYGGNRVKKVINYYSELEDKNYEEIINSNDIDWLKYRNYIVSIGDSQYVENVLRWYNGNGEITLLKPDLEEVKIYIKNQNTEI